MPHWLTEILDDEHPDLPWQPPSKLPTIGDLRDAIHRCALTLEGTVTPAVARMCFAKLVMAFEPGSKLSGEETKLRMAVWLEACGDMNDALWIDATTQAIQTLKWMPKPAEFRALVSHQLDQARKRRRRLEGMLEMARQPPRQAKFLPESDEVRTRGLRNSFRKVGDLFKAAQYERNLAAMEKREVEAWAIAGAEVATPAPRDLGPPAPYPPPEALPESLECRIELLRANIAFLRDMGIVDAIPPKERELAELEAAKTRGEAA